MVRSCAGARGVAPGILKGMYDGFSQSLEKANAEEAEQQKAFKELMVTKKKNLRPCS